MVAPGFHNGIMDKTTGKPESSRKVTYRYRSAITGKFVSRAYAEQHPDTTVRLTVKPRAEH